MMKISSGTLYRICLSYLAYSRLFLFIFRFLMKFEGFSFRSLKWWLLLNIFILFFLLQFLHSRVFFYANIQMSFNWFQLTFNKIKINKRRRKKKRLLRLSLSHLIEIYMENQLLQCLSTMDVTFVVINKLNWSQCHRTKTKLN